jgi:hypothetical protein
MGDTSVTARHRSSIFDRRPCQTLRLQFFLSSISEKNLLLLSQAVAVRFSPST